MIVFETRMEFVLFLTMTQLISLGIVKLLLAYTGN